MSLRTFSIRRVALVLALATVVPVGVVLATGSSASTPSTTGSLAQPASCETFAAPAGTGNRSGQLNGTLWGVSHVSGDDNYGSPANGWGSSTQTVCGTSQLVQPPTDVFVCNGTMVEGM